MYKFAIIGTSKSNENLNYYSKERLKIWGSLYFAGVVNHYWKDEAEFKKKATKEFANRHQFDFYDVIPFIASNDKIILDKLSKIEKHSLTEISNEVKQKSNVYANSLLFNGKTSFYYFSFFYSNENFDVKKFKSHVSKIKKIFNEQKVSYGKIASNVTTSVFNSNQINNIFILPNTSGRFSGSTFDEFIWINSIKESNEHIL